MSNTVIRKEKPIVSDHAPNGSASHAGLVDDLERLFMEQLKPGPERRSSVQNVPLDDPMMAELARIVGQQEGGAGRTLAPRPALPRAHDPFEAALADTVPRHEAIDPLKAFEEELKRFDAAHRSPAAPAAAPVSERYAPPVEPAPPAQPYYDPNAYMPPPPMDAHGQFAPQPAPVAAPSFDPPLDELRGFQPAPYSEPAAPPPAEAAYPLDPPPVMAPDFAAEEPARPRNRRVAILLGSAAAIALAGVVGAVVFRGGPRVPGDAPVIAAKTQPAKEKPSDPGGVEVPGQDRQVLARKVDEPKSGASVVNRDEQPVDLNQTPKRDGARVILPSPIQQGGSVSPTSTGIILPPGSSQPGLVQPGVPPQVQQPPGGEQPATAGGFEAKRVKSVRVGSDPSAPAAPPAMTAAPPRPAAPPVAAAPVPPPAAPIAAPTPAAPKVERPVAAAAPKSEARPTLPRPAGLGATTPGTIRTTRAAPAPAEEPTGDGAPLSLRPPSGAPARSAAAPVTTASTGGSGGYAVQLAAPGSESEARSVIQRLKQKHSDALSGHTPVVRSAQKGESTIYRVRVTGMSRDSANSLCARLKADGGTCFVAAN